MSIFGYPAKVTHYHAELDEWGRPLPPVATIRDAKVVEKQQLIRNGRGEEITVNGEVHVEGAIPLTFDDYFEYVNALGETVRYDVAHYEVRKFLGTDDVKKVIVYGRQRRI